MTDIRPSQAAFDIPHTKQALETALSVFYNSFSNNNSNIVSENISQVKTNNIDLVNKFLDTLMGSSAEERTKIQQTLITQNTTSKEKDPLPSYNVRAPYIEVYINGLLLVPPNIKAFQDSAWSADKKNFTNPNYETELNNMAKANPELSEAANELDVLFQSLKLEMPIGGVLGTISGSMTLFSRNPIEFLSFLWDTANIEATGLPECKLRFGWSIARSDGQVEKLLSPFLSFLITNTGITDPGKVIGSEFTLSLQDAGSCVLQNSSGDMALKPDYPQQQLRVLIEKCLGFRLFTLDDLLSLGKVEEQTTKTTESTASSGSTATAVLTASTTPVKTFSGSGNENIAANTPEAKNEQALNKAAGKLIDVTVANTNTINPSITVSSASAVTSVGDAINAKYVVDSTKSTTQVTAVQTTTTTTAGSPSSGRTFFLNEQTPALRLNSNTLENVIAQLLNIITCRWYPIDNNSLQAEIASISDNESKISQFQHSFDTTKDPVERKKIEEAAAGATIKIATACSLIWVPFFPPGIATTSGDYFGDITKETGAFLLIPKATSDFGLTASSFPLIYGPGGSSIPYFYGGAQNVFAKLTEAVSGSKLGYSNMVGEVLSLNTNFSNLTVQMKNNYDESITYRQNGQFISPKNSNRLQLKQRLEAETKALGSSNAKEYQALAEARAKNNFKAIRQRFKQSLAPRILANDVETGGSAKTVAVNKLKHRIGTFLNYPFTVSMTVLGDPYLVRQGIGAFEILNYYPSVSGETFKFNALVSGAYMPQKISYNLSLGDFTTEIQAMKIEESVKNTTQARIEEIVEQAATPTDSATTNAQNENILRSLETLNLETMSGNLTQLDSIYVLSDQQKRDIENKIALQRQSIEKLHLGFEKEEAALLEYKVSLISSYIDSDSTLKNTRTTADINCLKSQIRGVYSTQQATTNLLHYTVGLASKDVLQTGVDNTKDSKSRLTTLDTLYTKLKESRFSDIKNGLNTQSK